MHNAELYQENNIITRRDVAEIMEIFSPFIKWRDDGQDTLLDVGCGPGDVVMSFVLPKMPKNFKQLVGSDISEEMIQHARQFFERPNVSFEKLDINGDIRKFLDNHPEGFDHITSFYCLQWVPNQKKAVKNMYDLLNSTGDCVLLILAHHPYYDIYKELARNKKWAQFMENCDNFVSPFQNVASPSTEYSALLKTEGFSNYDVRDIERSYTFHNLRKFKASVKAVNPFMDNMTVEEQDEYLEDFVSLLVEMGMGQREENGKKFWVKLVYKLIIVYANK